MAGISEVKHPLHSRPMHLLLRLQAGFILAGPIGIAAMTPAAWALCAGVFSGAALFLWLYVGRYWTVRATANEIVARRFFWTHREPLSAIAGVATPWYANPLFGFWWAERRLLFRSGARIAFVGSRRGLERLARLVPTERN